MVVCSSLQYSFDQLWNESDLDKSNDRLRTICLQVFTSYLDLRPNIIVTRISGDGFVQSDGSKVFNIHYIRNGKAEQMQIICELDSDDAFIPSCIAYEN